MQFGAIKQAIFDWIKGATLGTAGLTIYWDEPNAPRPPMPAIRLSFISGVTGIGLDTLRSAGEPNKFRILGDRSIVLSINAYGAQSYQWLSDILTSISNPNAMETLRAQNVSVLRTSPPRELNLTLETKVESRTQMDVTLLATENKLIELAEVDSAEINGDIAGINLNSDIDNITALISANNGGV